MQVYTAGLSRPKAIELLSGPPRSGTFSVYSQKLAALAFVWLCSIIVWGNVSNYATIRGQCEARCAIQIAFALLVWVYVSMLLLLNFLAESQSLSRQGCFSHGTEAQWTGLVIFLWMPVLVSVSTINELPTIVATWFAWLGFFGACYASYKAYHSFKEEDLPSPSPGGFDEEDYVYG